MKSFKEIYIACCKYKYLINIYVGQRLISEIYSEGQAIL